MKSTVFADRWNEYIVSGSLGKDNPRRPRSGVRATHQAPASVSRYDIVDWLVRVVLPILCGTTPRMSHHAARLAALPRLYDGEAVVRHYGTIDAALRDACDRGPYPGPAPDEWEAWDAAVYSGVAAAIGAVAGDATAEDIAKRMLTAAERLLSLALVHEACAAATEIQRSAFTLLWPSDIAGVPVIDGLIAATAELAEAIANAQPKMMGTKAVRSLNDALDQLRLTRACLLAAAADAGASADW